MQSMIRTRAKGNARASMAFSILAFSREPSAVDIKNFSEKVRAYNDSPLFHFNL